MILQRIKVEGLVQGVGFRYYVYKIANELGITGIVRNEDDDSVYVEACGSDDALAEFRNALRQGPSRSRVDNVTILDEGICEGAGGFYIS